MISFFRQVRKYYILTNRLKRAVSILITLHGCFLVSSCRHKLLPGQLDVPNGVQTGTGGYRIIAPRWSPDGRHIAFLRVASNRKASVCLLDTKTNQCYPLMNEELLSPDRIYRSGQFGVDDPAGPVWNPDGNHIAFSRVEWFKINPDESMPGEGLWVYDLATHKVSSLAVHPEKYDGTLYYYRAPKWSKDGIAFAFLGEGLHGETALYTRFGPRLDPFYDMPRYDQYADVSRISWSPDGSRLAFRQGVLRTITADRVETLRVITPGTNQPPLRLRAPGRIQSIAWSPDGSMIALSCSSGNPTLPETHSLYLVTLKDGRLKPMGGNELSGLYAPTWVNEHQIASIRKVNDGYELLLESATGGGRRRLCKLPTDDMDWSPDKKQIVCASPKRNSGLLIVSLIIN